MAVIVSPNKRRSPRNGSRRAFSIAVIAITIFVVLAIVNQLLVVIQWNQKAGEINNSDVAVKADARDEIIKELFHEVASLQKVANEAKKALLINHTQSQQTVSETPRPTNPPTSTVPKSARKFVSYKSSRWEQLWLDNVDSWAKDRNICHVLLKQQAEFVHDFLQLTCTSYIGKKWCKMDDGFQALWYNTLNRSMFQITFDRPAELKGKNSSQLRPVIPGPEHEHIVSKFIFKDEINNNTYTEYIEPLVSHLRHPLAKCVNASRDPLWLALFGSYVIPVPRKPPGTGKMLFFDAGSASWYDSGFGPSVSYFVNAWNRHGISFDRIQVYEASCTPAKFYAGVPLQYQHKTVFRQCTLAVSENEETIDRPFVPNEILNLAKPNDYVVFKIDVNSQYAEHGTIKHIMKNDVHIDELLWENHVSSNYLMKSDWQPPLFNMTLRQSYDLFLNMRRKGIRAHSWV